MWRQYIAKRLVKPFVAWYLKKPRRFHYKKLQFIILPSVFHPRFFFSSKYLAAFVETLPLKGKRVCEPCTGSGFISLLAYQKGATVCCFDLNPAAVECVQLNLQKNFPQAKPQTFTVLQSNVFQSIPPQLFDVVFINPPYFFNEVKSTSQLAWNCGAQGEFFISFFSHLKTYLHPEGTCYMVLANNCEIERIQLLAFQYNLSFNCIQSKKISWEENYIFEIH